MTDSELVRSHHESANMKKTMKVLISICGKTHCCILVYYWWNEESIQWIKFQKIWIRVRNESHWNTQIHFQDMRKTWINSNWWRINSARNTCSNKNKILSEKYPYIPDRTISYRRAGTEDHASEDYTFQAIIDNWLTECTIQFLIKFLTF